MIKHEDEYGNTRYEYTPEEQKERENEFAKQKWRTPSVDDGWGSQGTVQGASNYGKCGTGGQS